MKKNRFLTPALQLIGIALLVLADQGLKALAVKGLADSRTHVLIPGFLGLQLTQNTGAAFSLFSSSTALLSVVTGVVLLGIFIALVLIPKKAKIYDVLVPLIIAGGAGNLVDRIRRGYVIDYIRTLFIDFPIFNFADILITCACGVLIVWLIYEMVRDARKPKTPAVDGEEA